MPVKIIPSHGKSEHAEELHDLKNDAHQIHNLTIDSKHAAMLESLRVKLMAESEEGKDPRPEDAFDRPP
jgi:hypothetical protein